MTIEKATVYEHPWVYKYNQLLFEANIDVYNKAHWFAAALTFKFVFECWTANFFGAILTGTLI